MDMKKKTISIDSDSDKEFYSGIANGAYVILGLSGSCSVEVIVTDEDEIRLLNKEFRMIDETTDVLSFPSIVFDGGVKKFDKKNFPLDFDSETGCVFLGSIAINEKRALEQAETFGHSAEREKAYLFAHGLLHLLGYDHVELGDRRVMRTLEENILSKLGLGVK